MKFEIKNATNHLTVDFGVCSETVTTVLLNGEFKPENLETALKEAGYNIYVIFTKCL